MLQYNPSISGSLSVTGSLIVTNGVIGTVNGVDIQIFSSSISQVVTNIQTATGSQDERLTSIESFTSSVSTTNTFTSSTSARLSALETSSASVDTLNTNQNSRLGSLEIVSASNISRITALETTSASVDTLNTTQNNRLGSLEEKTGSLATTGSNTFYGQQIFSGSLYVQDNLIVQGSSSLQNITASAVSIGTNIVYLNTDTPAVRFAGLTVQDSGSSAGVTGSMLWDSLCNRWIYSNPSGVGYSGGMLLSGPRATNLGEEPTLTCNYIAKSGGGDHLYNSCIVDDGTTICVKGNFIGTGAFNLNSSTPTLKLTDCGATGNSGDVYLRAEKTGVGYNNLTTVAYSYNLTGGSSETSFLNIGSSGISCFFSTICTPLLSINSTSASPAILLNNTSGGTKADLTITENTGFILNSYEGAGARGIDLRVGGTSGLMITSGNNVCLGGNLIVNGGTLLMNCDTTTASDARINFYTKSSSTGDRVALYGYNLSATTSNCEISYQAFGYCTLNNQGYINFQTKNTSGWCNTMYLINGRVGIGVANPSVKLQIDGSLTLKSSSNQSVQIWNDGPVGANIGGNLEFRGTYRNSDNDSVIYGKIFGGKENASDGNFAGYLSFSTYEYPNSLAERLRINSSGIACFSNTICSANLSSSGFLKAHGSMKTFIVEKNLDERLSNSNYFRMTSSSGGFQVIVYSFSQNVGVGWSGSQIFQAVSAPYWGGWVGSSANVSQIGGESGVISSAVIGNDGTITFRVNTGNNGTNTQGTIRSYIQVNAFNIDGVTLTAL
jgi:hypothetical protein